MNWKPKNEDKSLEMWFQINEASSERLEDIIGM